MQAEAVLKGLIYITVILLQELEAQTQKPIISPCPRYFVYQGKNPEPDRWYGIVTLLSEIDLEGVWLRLIFDKPSKQLGNWFGEAKPREANKEYTIKNRNFHLKANVPETIRFYIQYDTSEPPPKLIGFRLNARTLCPEPDPESDSMKNLYLSNRPATTQSPATPAQVDVTNNPFIRPGGGFSLGSNPFAEDENVNSFFRRQNNVNLDDICGTIVKPNPLIIGGYTTTEGEYPWHAAVYQTKGANFVYWCGGSLISRNHLITVAHAVIKWGTNTARDPESFIIYLGKYYLNRFTKGIQERLVTEITPHPDFDPQSLMNDIAILKLAAPVEITEYVRPICLWQGSTDLNSIVGEIGSVVGWGSDGRGKPTERLMQAQMPVASFEKCAYSLPTFYPHFLSNRTYCAGFRNGTSVCNGDSGGGMVFPIPTPQDTIRWYLRGLVSLSADVSNKLNCDAKHFIIFTDVAKYLNWIRQVMLQ